MDDHNGNQEESQEKSSRPGIEPFMVLLLIAGTVIFGVAFGILASNGDNSKTPNSTPLGNGAISDPISSAKLSEVSSRIEQPVLWLGVPRRDVQLRYAITNKEDHAKITDVYYLNPDAAQAFSDTNTTFSVLVSTSVVTSATAKDLRKNIPSNAVEIKRDGLLIYVPPKSVKKSAIFFIMSPSSGLVGQVKYPTNITRDKILRDARNVSTVPSRPDPFG